MKEKEKNRPAGLRTHVLVCMASTLIALVEQQMIYEISRLSSSYINLSFGRLSVGVLSGIGFIGAGTIMMSKSKVVGLTTAASLWCTGCLGLINGMGYSVLALICAVLVIVVLLALRLSETVNLSRIIEIQYVDKGNVSINIEKLLDELDLKVKDYSVSFHKDAEEKICTTRYNIVFKNKEEIINAMSKLSDIENVIVVKFQNIL